MNYRTTLSLLLLTICLTLPSTGFAEVLDTTLNASEFEGQSALYFSRPTTVQVIDNEARLLASDRDSILQIRMELITFDVVGNRVSYIRFSKKHITEYIMAIENFLSMARDADGSSLDRDGTKIASLISCNTMKGPLYLVFQYHQPRGSTPYLSIGTTYDPEIRSGVHCFTPADAQELVSLLVKFAHS